MKTMDRQEAINQEYTIKQNNSGANRFYFPMQKPLVRQRDFVFRTSVKIHYVNTINFIVFLVELPQFDANISRMLTYSQDFI
ncbi:hypothetical protein, partial [Bacillus sp. B4EP4a]|uniref:hypothetical protein n=1 Tax=Bacillus sp. B4EP4a TaxID=2590665 RepID=UPI001C679065